MSDESLFSGKMELADLMESSFEADGAESLQRIEDQIQERIREQIAARSDGLRRFIVFAERLAADAKAVAKSWEARAAKARAYTFEAMKHANVRRIDTPSGSLSIRDNGGVEPLEIYEPALVPDKFCDVTVTMPADAWRMVVARTQWAGLDRSNPAPRIRISEPVPSNSAIREALAKPCELCGGSGEIGPLHSPADIVPPGPVTPCGACGGSGKNSVAGARLLPRGSSLVVR
jgi:hypothetical protein